MVAWFWLSSVCASLAEGVKSLGAGAGELAAGVGDGFADAVACIVERPGDAVALSVSDANEAVGGVVGIAEAATIRLNELDQLADAIVGIGRDVLPASILIPDRLRTGSFCRPH